MAATSPLRPVPIRRARRLGAAVLLMACAPGCFAPPGAPRGESFTVNVDNDMLFDSDNGYTNAVGLTWASAEIENYEPGSFIRDWVALWGDLPGVDATGHGTWSTWTLSSEMHTPHDIELVDPPLDDQPYAGLLAIDSAIHSRVRDWAQTWNLRLGVVGPVSRADDAHEDFHDDLGGHEPEGWDTQLPNEPLVNVDYSAARVVAGDPLGDLITWRLVQHASLSAGNYFTGGGLGAYAEIGWNLPDSLATAALWNNLRVVPSIDSGRLDERSVLLYAGVSGLAVAHYLPLDGTLFHSSRNVNSEPFVGVLRLGLSCRHERYIFGLGGTWFTETFEGEPERSSFATLSVTKVF